MVDVDYKELNDKRKLIITKKKRKYLKIEFPDEKINGSVRTFIVERYTAMTPFDSLDVFLVSFGRQRVVDFQYLDGSGHRVVDIESELHDGNTNGIRCRKIANFDVYLDQ